MAGVLPVGGPWGDLSIEEVLDEYNGPILFTCRNDLGHAFVGMSIAADSASETFAIVPVSEVRLANFLASGISVRRMFSESEGPVGTVNIGPNYWDWVQYDRAQFPEEFLPDYDLFAEGERPVDGVRFDETYVALMASAMSRPVSAVRIFTETDRHHGFSLRDAVLFLGEFQEAAAAVGAADGHSTQEAGRDNEFDLVGIGHGSFVFMVAPTTSGRLFAAPTTAMRRMMTLVGASAGSEDEFSAHLAEFGRVAIAHVRDFFAALSDSNAAIDILTAGPKGPVEQASASVDQIRRGLGVLRSRKELPTETIELEAYLTAVNHTLQRFGLTEVAPTGRRRTPRRINGVIDGTLAEFMNGLSAGTVVRYHCSVMVERTAPTFTDEQERTVKRLMRIVPVDDGVHALPGTP